jgi:hypothetical protein
VLAADDHEVEAIMSAQLYDGRAGQAVEHTAQERGRR